MRIESVHYTATNILNLLSEYKRFYINAYESGCMASLEVKMDLDILLEKSNLTDRQAEAINLYYKEGMTQDEVAEVLGVSRIAVRYLLNWAEKKIKNTAEKWGESDAL